MRGDAARSAATAIALAVLLARPARAHDPFEITTDARLAPDRLELTITMAGTTGAALCGVGRELSPSTFPLLQRDLEACARDLYVIATSGLPLTVLGARARLTPEDDLEAVVTYAAPRPGPLELDAVHLERLRDPTYGALLTVTSAERFYGQKLLRAEERRLTVEVPAPPGEDGATDANSASAATTPSFATFVRFGVEHIASGYDHLLFLAGALAYSASVRAAVGVVTCFTLAHSLTLGLSVLGRVTPPSAVVEPLIALSVAAVAAESLLFRERGRVRWVATFSFGLLHGFGFAGALQELIAADPSAGLRALAGFNLGVELGQAAFAALLVPLLLALRARTGVAQRAPAALSLIALALGVVWFVERVAR